MSGKPKTLREIAAAAGVSATTASLYINGKAKQFRLSDETCHRIQHVIDRENYIPNLSARAMASKRTDLIGCMIYQSLTESFWAEIISGIDEILAPHGIHLLLTVTGGNHQSELDTFQYLRAKGVDGVFWVPVLEDHTAQNAEYVLALSQELPIVSLTERIPGLCSVYNDGFTGAWEAADYLLKTGHRSLALLGRSRHQPDRVEGFVQRASQSRVEVRHFTDPTALLASCPSGTGVFCVSDQRAMKLYQQAALLGRRIPEELSVIGFDNLPFGELLSPSLTTVNQEKSRLGQEAARLMLNLLGMDQRLPESIRLETHLVIRSSVHTTP